MEQAWLWVGFNVFVLLMLILDLGVFHRNAHVVKVKEALTWSAVWILLALLFNVAIYWYFGPETALEFLSGYLIEKSLSVDNLFVILLIFTYFKTPERYQHRVLFWGILGALVMRGCMIFIGAALITRFHSVIYVLGVFLLVTAGKLILDKHEKKPADNLLVKVFKKFFAVTPDYYDGHFFVKLNQKMLATPLLLVLLTVEFTDFIFAIDSIPAIFAVTPDPFIVYTSNVFAILGLRSLYFALAGVMQLFHYIKQGLATILAFVGVKMLLMDVYKIPTVLSLGVIIAVLLLSVLASILWPPKNESNH